MTVPNTTTRNGPYYANGATVAFPFTFRALDKDDVQVVRIASDGTATAVSPALFNVNLSSNGGSAVFTSPPVAGDPLYVQLDPAFSQEISFENEGAFLPEVITEALDRGAQRSLYLREILSRTMLFPVGEAGTALIGAAFRLGGKVLGFNPITGAAEVQGSGSFKGDPGGNVMAIGRFIVASILSIPVGSDLVQTSGHGVNGKGAARYVYDAAVNAAYVTANPLSSFITANGRGFRIAETYIDVMMFGARFDAVTDDTAAWRAAANYVQNTVRFEDYATSSPSAGPQNLFAPAGLSLVTDNIPIRRSCSIYGDGHSETSGGTRIQQQTPGKDIFTIDPIAQGASVSFSDLTLRANGGGGSGGSLINFKKSVGGGTANSCRVFRCFFFTPQSFALRVQRGDDYVIDQCTFDASATNCISLGWTAAAAAAAGDAGGSDLDVVTNFRLVNCDFFDIELKTFLLWNCRNIVIANNTIWHSADHSDLFIDGYETSPVQLRNIVVTGNAFKGLRSIARLQAVSGFVCSGNGGEAMGGGAGATKSAIEVWGACSRVVVEANALSGSFDTKSFYDDSGGTVTGGAIVANVFTSTGGSGPALRALNTTGAIGGNSFIGFATNSIGQRWSTAGNSVNPGAPGAIALGSAAVVNFTVSGARQGDLVQVGSAGLAPFVPDGFIVTAYVSAPNQISVRYLNQAGANPQGVPGHDISVAVTR